LPLLAAIPELNFKLLAKPVPNQPQMVELVASPKLTPGLYVVQYNPSGGNGWFAIFSVAASVETENPFCLDLVLPGGPRGLFERANSELNSTVPPLASFRYTKCDASTAPNAPAVQGVNSGESNASVSGPTDLIASWDKALGLGQTVSIPMCRDRGGFSTNCEQGTLSLSLSEVSYNQPNGQKLFAAPSSQIKFKRDFGLGASGVFSLDVGGKHSRYLYVVQGMDCPDRMEKFPACPAAGMEQQKTVSDWVEQTLGKLASGSSNPSPQN
jgi:hypothetical protein